MNRKEAILVAVVVLATFVGGAFADTVSTAPARTTLQTTSLDIEILNILPGGLFGGSSTNGVFVCNYCPPANLTAAFGFAPSKGFVEVKIIILTFTYITFTQTTPRDLSIRLNGNSPTIVQMQYASISAAIVNLTPQDLHLGANVIDIGAFGNQVQAQVFEIRLTVEYTFMG